jgi:hypothetical protein
MEQGRTHPEGTASKSTDALLTAAVGLTTSQQSQIWDRGPERPDQRANRRATQAASSNHDSWVSPESKLWSSRSWGCNNATVGTEVLRGKRHRRHIYTVSKSAKGATSRSHDIFGTVEMLSVLLLRLKARRCYSTFLFAFFPVPLSR